MMRSENVPSDSEGSTDGDESEEDDDHTSGYNSAGDDFDLSAFADLTIRDVSSSFALSDILHLPCDAYSSRSTSSSNSIQAESSRRPILC